MFLVFKFWCEIRICFCPKLWIDIVFLIQLH